MNDAERQDLNDLRQARNDEHQAGNDERELAHISRHDFTVMRWEARIAYVLMAVMLAGGLWLLDRERQHRLEQVANTAGQVVLVRCASTNRVNVVLTEAFLAQRRLAVKRYAQGQLEADQLAVSLKALDRAIKGLEPQPCAAQAAAIKKAANP